MGASVTFEAGGIDGDIPTFILRTSLDVTSTAEFSRQDHEHLDAGYSKVIFGCRLLGCVSSLDNRSPVRPANPARDQWLSPEAAAHRARSGSKTRSRGHETRNGAWKQTHHSTSTEERG